MNKNLYIDINILQTVPSSNINRDDTGAPKTAFYGGVTRARVSSQAWKRAVRTTFAEDGVDIGTRTKQVPTMLAQELQESYHLNEKEAWNKALDALSKAITPKGKKDKKIKIKKDKETGIKETEALLMVSRGQISKLAKYISEHEKLDKDDKEEIKKIFLEENSLDLALFGRMVADNPELNVDAAAQVAHAISTHEIIPEYDYFTALDDLQDKETNGAAHLDTTQYDSATLYRYANINMIELKENLGSLDAIEGALLFIKDFSLSMPTGKQNSFANKTLPNYVMVTVRDDTPVNLVSAFESPVVANAGEGYTINSVKRLENEFTNALQFVDQPIATFVVGKYETRVGKQAANLNDMLNKLQDVLKKAVENENINN